MGYFNVYEIYENFKEVFDYFSDNEFPHNFLNVIEEVFGENNIKGYNPNSLKEVNWKDELLENKMVLLKIEYLDVYLLLILRKKGLVIEVSNNEISHKFIFNKNYDLDKFRASLFSLVNMSAKNFKKTTFYKRYKENQEFFTKRNSTFNMKLFLDNIYNDLGVDDIYFIKVDVGDFKIFTFDIIKNGEYFSFVFTTKFELFFDKNVPQYMRKYLKEYIDELKQMNIKFN
jgi:hypothetical protein